MNFAQRNIVASSEVIKSSHSLVSPKTCFVKDTQLDAVIGSDTQDITSNGCDRRMWMSFFFSRWPCLNSKQVTFEERIYGRMSAGNIPTEEADFDVVQHQFDMCPDRREKQPVKLRHQSRPAPTYSGKGERLYFEWLHLNLMIEAVSLGEIRTPNSLSLEDSVKTGSCTVQVMGKRICLRRWASPAAGALGMGLQLRLKLV